MNDDDMLAAVRSSLTGVKNALTDVRMERTPEAITGRARARRLRRGVTGAAAASLGLGLALGVGSGGAPARSVHVNLTAWSVNTTPAGRVDVTVRDLKDPAHLRRTLADAGVPAVVTFGEFCGGGRNLPQLMEVLSKVRGGDGAFISINRAAMPAGTELTISIVKVAVHGPKQGFTVAFGLVRKDARLTCHAQQPGVKKPEPGGARVKKPEPRGPGVKKPEPGGPGAGALDR